LTRQTPATIAVTHYFDVKRECVDCGQPFIFFAREQQHWYEELGFGLESDGVRCVPCRRRQHGISRARERYEELFHVPVRTTGETLEMAECGLSLIEASVFHRRQAQRVRMLLKAIRRQGDETVEARCQDLLRRVIAVERRDERGG
jgi:hypothetical protein